MARIFPEVESFGTQFARSLGGGLSQGISSGLDLAQKLAAKKAELKQKQDFVSQYFPQNKPSSGSPNPQDGSSYPDQLNNMDETPNYTDEQIAAAMVVDPNLGKYLQSTQKEKRERDEFPKKEYLKGQYKNLAKHQEKINDLEDSLPSKDIAVKSMEEAIESGTLSGNKEWLANFTGHEGFRNAAGAELRSAVKSYFLGDLNSITGRPNQFIEQQIVDAYPKAGNDPIANQKMLTGLKMQNEIAHARVDKTRELEEKYLAKMGYLPPNFEQIVNKELRPKVNEIEKNTIKQLNNLEKFQREYQKMATKSLKPGEMLMLNPEGTYEAVEKSKYREAKDAGYIKVS